MNTETPETDANQEGWEYHKQYGWHDSLSERDPIPWPEFAGKMELERDEARRGAALASEEIRRLIKGLPSATLRKLETGMIEIVDAPEIFSCSREILQNLIARLNSLENKEIAGA